MFLRIVSTFSVVKEDLVLLSLPILSVRFIGVCHNSWFSDVLGPKLRALLMLHNILPTELHPMLIFFSS